MTTQNASQSFLATYEKDTNAVYDLCRICLCKTGDIYIAIDSILPWSKLESCTAQKIVEKILDKELSNVDPQPRRICAKCVRLIKAIDAFQNRCIESDNILTKFHKHMENQSLLLKAETTAVSIQNDFLFGIDDLMFPEQLPEKSLPVFDSDLLRLPESHVVLEKIRRELNPHELHSNAMSPPPPSLPTIVCTKEIIHAEIPPTDDNTTPSPTVATLQLSPPPKSRPKRKLRKAEKLNDVDLYVRNVLRNDFKPKKSSKRHADKRTASRKSDKSDDDFTGLCEQCGLTFSNSNEYKKHIRNHEDKTKQTFRFTCNFCFKGFNHKQTYYIHHNSHTHAETFECDMCGKHLATKNGLRIHFRYHLGIKNHVCPKCGHRFVTPREMRDHIEKKHAVVRAIACTYSDCSETFDSEFRLNLHLRVHETNYAFVCDICGVATVSKFRLGIHKKIHTGEMKRQCPICQKSLAHDQALRRHIRNVHGVQKFSIRSNGTSYLVNDGNANEKTARTKPLSMPKPNQAKRMITLDGLILTN